MMEQQLSSVVEFEIAKLIKEKSIKIDVEEVLFYIDEVNNIKEHQIKNRDVLHFADFNHVIDENEYQTYSIVQIIDWIYDKHKIWISVGGECDYKFKFEIHKWNWYELEKTYRMGHVVLGSSLWDTSSNAFNSPKEAYQEAIKYTLKNLI